MKTRFSSRSVIFFNLIFSFTLIALFAGCQPKAKSGSSNAVNLVAEMKIKGLDPALADDRYSGNEVGRTYEGLLEFHYLKRPYQLVPLLADGMPDISKDGKTYTFKIKKGVLFQDDPCFKETQGKGRELTAADFVYSYLRLADPKLLSPGWWIFDGKIVGLNEWRDQVSKTGTVDYSKTIEGLKALDRYTLQIKLKARSYQFPYFLAMPFAGVVAKEAVEHYGKEFASHPVGTGPFRLKEYNPSEKLVWIKNPTYRKELYPSEGDSEDRAAGRLQDAGKPLPLSDEVVVRVYVETQPMWLNFLSGNLDYSIIPKDNFGQAIDSKGELKDELVKKGIRLQKDVELDVTHESFNMADPVFGKNKLLRQALSLAFNQIPLIEIFYNGRAVPAQGPIPPGLSGYDENYKNPYRQFNLEKAKELLAKAGYPGGKGLAPIEYATIASSTNRQMTEYLQKSFEALGVKLQVNSYSWPEFQAAVKNKKGQMWGFAWGADYPDAENFLQLFYSKNTSPGPNDANYSNPEFDKLYEQSLTMPDGPERTKLYRKMVDLVAEDVPWIFGSHRVRYHLTYGRLRNFKPTPFEHTISKYLRIDSGKAAQQ